MRTIVLAAIGALGIGTPAWAQPAEKPFDFPADSLGKALGQLLPPAAPANQREPSRPDPKPRAPRPGIDYPEASLETPSTRVPGPKQAAAKPLRPYAPPDAAPLTDYREDPSLPRRTDLPDFDLIRLPMRNVNLPAELPAQTRYVTDRAPLDDPTADVGIDSATRSVGPLRTAPASFLRLNLPEPFEHRASVSPQSEVPPFVAPVPVTPK